MTGLEPVGEALAARWGRRLVLTGLLVVVLAGLVGVLGVRTTTVRAEQGGYSLSVEHAAVARAGFDVPWQVTVHHPGGFGASVTLALTASYLDIYETQAFHPEPAASRRDGDTLYLTFDAAEGDTFVVAYDAYVQPSAQRGASARVAVVQDGAELVAVDIRTLLLP